MRASGIGIILRSAKEGPDPVRVQGAPGSAQALIIARYVYAFGKPVAVICPDEDAAAEMAADLECVAESGERTALPVWLLPGWEQSPYSPIAPSIRIRFGRLSVLQALSRHAASGPAVFVTTLAGSCQATLPPDVFRRHSIELRAGSTVESRERLAARLMENGYLRLDTVEDPGTFALRGEIVDIFPPDCRNPVRIELFDDMMERLRYFDPATQRTLGEPVARLVVPPAREVLVNASTSGTIRERLKARADDLGIRRSIRDPMLASIQGGNYPEHCDAWAPFAYDTPGEFWDYFPHEGQVIWSDELGCLEAWEGFRSRQEELSAESVKNDLILPPAGELYAWDPPRAEALAAKSRLYLDRIELEEAGRPAARHRVFIENNTDLVAGNRHSLGELEPKIRLWLKEGFRVVAFASTQGQLERVRFLLEERSLPCGPGGPGVIQLGQGSLSQGFRWTEEGLVYLTESEILGTPHRRTLRKGRSTASGSATQDWSGLQALSDLSVGDLVVHMDHGIGRYQGLVRLDLLGAPSDFLLLEYANKDRLYLPVYRLNAVQKYVGAGEGVALDRLGSQHFAKAKEKVKEAVRRLAIDLVQLYAQRKVRPGIRLSPRDGLFREFEAKFPFDETPDQAKSIDDILGDLESGKVMDRLICGDVGYGKTEVAMRAAFRAVTDGKQVAVLVPTTVLAFQHEQSFRARFKDYPISIESISRFKNVKEQKSVLGALESGRLDIVIGTHRLLSSDVKFRDLGLIVVDEEHRFGVEHKEKLKALKVDTHVLTLTATPIPRTLHMALSGLREISLINTAPVDRLPIRTYVSRFDGALIQRAINFELGRGGQVFFLHNRVQSIDEMARRISELVPAARISVAHGQMGEGELERKMLQFYRHESDILLCTTIIESGLDVPSANTIIIDRADQLGLAQLYQIRGRVGRGQERAYAYLLLPEGGGLSEDAKRRIEVIQRFVELGSGFSIASHDLEIRGGGDLLGPQQSGHIAAVGFDLYTELLEEAIRSLEGRPHSEPDVSRREPEIKAPFPAYLSDEYVPDIHQRLALYRRFSAATREAEVEKMVAELLDRFGPLPLEAQNLLWLIRIKQLLKNTGMDSLTVGPERISLLPGPGSRLDPARAIALVSSQPDRYQLTPDSKLVARAQSGSLRDLYFYLETLFREFGADS
ncbi:MAG: transcription-repair coupling factor [Oligoflexia bacterium]|nr:transcription-repair coupling factor [Oligoflexia bacterium]